VDRFLGRDVDQRCEHGLQVCGSRSQERGQSNLRRVELHAAKFRNCADAYGKWNPVENSSLAMAESAGLLNAPGRKCSDGLSVPVKSADWIKVVQDPANAIGSLSKFLAVSPAELLNPMRVASYTAERMEWRFFLSTRFDAVAEPGARLESNRFSPLRQCCSALETYRNEDGECSR
jgi:hypothetical protein